LENIKRKVPAGRKQPASQQRLLPTETPPQGASGDSQSLQDQIDRLTGSQESMRDLVGLLEGKYQTVLNELVSVQRTVVQQAGLIQNLMQYHSVSPGGELNTSLYATSAELFGGGSQNSSQFGQFVQAGEQKSLPGGDFTGPSLERMNQLAARAAQAPRVTRVPSPPPQPSSNRQALAAAGERRPLDSSSSLAQALGPFLSGLQARSLSPDNLPTNSTLPPDAFLLPSGGDGLTQFPGYAGLEVFTIGQLVERDGNGAEFSAHPNDSAGPWTGSSAQTPGSSLEVPFSGSSVSSSSDSDLSISRSASPRLRVRRGAYVPGWAVPPRVLVVDDDAVSRTLSSKLLHIAGCTFDVAVDGEVAVQRMNLEKYDLVLMDIVMPKLDGVSATSQIRQFDLSTPIISMTSNSTPSDLKTYFQHGMNDILSKPFGRDNLINVLEKHLMHLKVIGHLNQVPRSLGIPPLNDASFDQALTLPMTSVGEFDYRPNPLAGMGVSDADYELLVQGIVSDGLGTPHKRGFLEDDESGSNDMKRQRFEVVE